MKKRKSSILLLMAISICGHLVISEDAIAKGPSKQGYDISYLGQLKKANWTNGHAINNNDQVAGSSNTYINGRKTNQLAVLFEDGQATNLNTLSNNAISTFYSEATGINLQGDIVGFSEQLEGSYFESRAFVYSNGLVNHLGANGRFASKASSINDNGTVIGNTTLSSDRFAFIYTQETGMMDLIDLAVNRENWQLLDAYNINNAGKIVGFGIFGNEACGYLFDNGTLSRLPSLPGTYCSQAKDINNNDVITGLALHLDNEISAFTFDGVNITEIPEPSGYRRIVPLAINDNGVVVGKMWHIAESKNVAFIYDIENGTRDLNELIRKRFCCEIIEAIDINNAGKIAVTVDVDNGTDTFDFEHRAYLLTPAGN